jgi:hypothetical protein
MSSRANGTHRRATVLLVVVGLLGSKAAAAPPPQPSTEAIAFFESRVRPVLVEQCVRCHGAAKQRGRLRLDSRAALLTGGDRGPAIVPGRPESSLLVKAISHEDDEVKMPPKTKLPKEQIADLTQWVKLGAPWPGGDATATTRPSGDEMVITDKDRSHWAFQPVRRPPVPEVKDQAWVSNTIDAFILAQLEAKGLRPNPRASPRQLVRRLYYDLTGLPPSPEEVEAFAANPTQEAYDALVDRLLASPHYGEKWGRHWLDLVRFAETNSYERDNPKPNAWRYRDYVIRSLSSDKPYDRFVREQLAGDELSGADADAYIATGFYRLGIWDDEPTDAEQARYDGLDDIVTTTGQVFLGLTIDCARCHHHKIDPIPQHDYYRLLAFFQNINHFNNGGPTDEVQLIVDADGRQTIGPLDLLHNVMSGGRKRPHHTDTILCVTEHGSESPDTFVLRRGNPAVRGDKVEPGFPQVLTGKAPVLPPPRPGAMTSGRRTVLAEWLTSPDNPLPARVMVNRLWQHHFGRGIVRSPNNFGLQGDRPTHPELLDWLASELVAQGWRLKPLHRLIVTSSAYQMSSAGNPEARAIDPINDLFWRFDMRRLTAEELRDSILSIVGKLNSKMYGPGVYVALPKEVLATQSMPGNGWGKSPLEEQNRRSTYIHVKRSLLTPILESFDLPETDRSSPVRFSTTQPTQALAMLNSDFLNQEAAVFATRLLTEAGNNVAEQVRLALRLAIQRPPSDTEVRRGVELIAALRDQDGASTEVALRSFCLLVLNLNELIYLD